MVIIEAIMSLFIKEVLIPEKLIEVVTRYIDVDLLDDFPQDCEDAALFWLNKSTEKLKQQIVEEVNKDEASQTDETPTLPLLQDLSDISDGCCLAALFSLYCPDDLQWQEICFNETMSMADSIYNLQLVQFFCQEKLPYNVCFLSIEDFLYLDEAIRPNVLAFIADILYLFEIKIADCVRRPGLLSDEETSSDEPFSSIYHRELPTPAEMKACSLQHHSWVDNHFPKQRSETIRHNGSPSNRTQKKRKSPTRKSRNHSANYSDEDEELTRYFTSSLDFKPDTEASPEILMVSNQNSEFKTIGRTGPQSIASFTSSRRDYESKSSPPKSSFENGSFSSGSPLKSDDVTLSAKRGSHYMPRSTDSSPSRKNVLQNTTSFAKLNSENSMFGASTGSAINIAYMQKKEKPDKSDLKLDIKPSNQTGGKSEVTSPVKVDQNFNMRPITNVNNRNSSETVKDLLTQTEYQIEDRDKANKKVAQVQKPTVDTEIASQISNVRLMLEEKRKKIENDRKMAEEEWKSQRQNIGQEAFLRALHKKDDSNAESPTQSKKSPDQKTNISVSEISDDLDKLKKKWLAPNTSEEEQKPFRLNESGTRTNFEDLKTSLDVMETSLDELDSDLERLQTHEQIVKKDAKSNSQESKFFLHESATEMSAPLNSQQPIYATPQPVLSSQQSFSQAAPLQQQMPPQRQMWNDQPPYHQPDTQMNVPRRGQWGQPVVPVVSSNGINQWATVPISRPTDYGYSNSHYDMHNNRIPGMTFGNQTFPASEPPSFGYGTPNYNSMQQPMHQPPMYPNQNGGMSQYGYSNNYMSQYGNPNNMGQFNQNQQQFAPNPQMGYPSHLQQTHMPHHEPFQSMQIHPYGNPPVNAQSDQFPQHHRQPGVMPPTHMIAQHGATMGSVSQLDDAASQLSSSPTSKGYIGRTFRVTKPKMHTSQFSNSEQVSPTHSSTLSQHSNDDVLKNKNVAGSNSNVCESINLTNDGVAANETFEKGFFISFGNEKKPKPKPKQLKSQMRDQGGMILGNSNNIPSNKSDVSEESKDSDQSKQSDGRSAKSTGTPTGVGFVIGTDLVAPDPFSELEMAKRKESIIMQSLKRRAEAEEKRIEKEHAMAKKKEEERYKRELSDRKKEEERFKRQQILEQYRQRKALEESEKDYSASSGMSNAPSRSNSTLLLNRVGRRNVSPGKARPKSLHVSSSNMADFTSLDCKPSRIADDHDVPYNAFANPATTTISTSSNSSRPHSALSSQSGFSLSTTSTSRRMPSPTQSHNPLPSLPPSLMLGRHRGPPSDSSDFGSTFSEYTGPKLYVKPSQKSNKILIINAINVVLAGAVHNETKRKVIQVRAEQTDKS